LTLLLISQRFEGLNLMSLKKLSVLILSQIVTLFIVGFLGLKLLQVGKSFAISFLLAVIYLIYSFYIFINELLIVIKDKKAGVIEDTLVFCNYKVLFKGIEHKNNIPPIPVATFRSINSD